MLKTFPWDLEERINEARKYFDEGWSIHVAMNKAGFKGNWQTRKDIVTNHVIVKMIEENNERFNKKRRINLG